MAGNIDRLSRGYVAEMLVAEDRVCIYMGSARVPQMCRFGGFVVILQILTIFVLLKVPFVIY